MTANSRGRRGSRFTNLGTRAGRMERWQYLDLVSHSVHALFSCVCCISLPCWWCGFQDQNMGQTWVQWEPWSQHDIPQQRGTGQGLLASNCRSLTTGWAALDFICVSQVGDIWGQSKCHRRLMTSVPWLFRAYLVLFSLLSYVQHI